MNRKTVFGVAGALFFSATALFYSAGNTYEQGECMQLLKGIGIHSIDDAIKVIPKDTAQAHEYVDMVIAAAKDAKKELLAVPAADRTFANTVAAYDEIGGMLGFVAELAESYQSISPDVAGRSDPYAKAKRAMSDLMMDVALYQAIKEYHQGQHKNEQLSSSDQYYLEEVLDDFKRGGYDLPAEQFEKVRKLKQEENDLYVAFSSAIDQDNSFIAVDEADLDGVDRDFIAKQKRDEDGKVILPTDWPTRAAVPAYCKNGAVRRAWTRAYLRRAYPDNIKNLESLLAKRHELAAALGYKSYAHLDLADKMIKTPEKARTFVNDMYARARKKADAEFAELTKDLPEGVELINGKMQPGDGGYVRAHYEKQFGYDQREVAKYFPVQATVDGIIAIYEKFMGIKLVHHKTVDGAWDPLVQALEVRSKDDKLLGFIFMDLHPRPNKYGHACCGNVVPALTGKGDDTVSVSLLICNFPQPSDHDPGLLTHEDVTTFFHEFGHAIHGMLGRTQRYSFAGTNTKLDYVELPSQILEEWMWDRDLLKMVSGHYQTGEKLPDELIDTMLKLRLSGSGSMVVGQMAYANIALQCHDERPIKDTDEIVHGINAEYFPNSLSDPDHHMQAAFGHLGGYKSGYYGYMFSRAYAADVLARVEQHGLLNEEIGQEFVKWILAPGGSQDPNDLLEGFLGRKPSLDAFCSREGLE